MKKGTSASCITFVFERLVGGNDIISFGFKRSEEHRNVNFSFVTGYFVELKGLLSLLLAGDGKSHKFNSFSSMNPLENARKFNYILRQRENALYAGLTRGWTTAGGRAAREKRSGRVAGEL